MGLNNGTPTFSQGWTGVASYEKVTALRGVTTLKLQLDHEHEIVYRTGLISMSCTVDGKRRKPKWSNTDEIRILDGEVYRTCVLVTDQRVPDWPAVVPRIVSCAVDGVRVPLEQGDLSSPDAGRGNIPPVMPSNGSSGVTSFDLRSIESPAWHAVLDLEDQKRALGDDIAAIPTGKWNRLIDRLYAAIDHAVQEPAVLDRLRAAIPTITDPVDREFVYQVIAPLVVWQAEDIETVRNDPRVALTAEELVGAPALYLAENSDGTLEDIYSWDLVQTEEVDEQFELFRDLSRIGGAPTLVPDMQPSDDAFLMQIDFRGIAKNHSEQLPLLRLLDEHGAPTEGVLQVFHTTLGDSETDPDVSNGGATLIYLPELSVAARLPVDMDAECAVYQPSRVSASFGLSFSNGPASCTDYSSLTVENLQRIADIWARNGRHTEQYRASTDPFSATELPVTRMFGVQSYDFDGGDSEVLHRDLPLTGDDHHVLFLSIAGEHSFDTVFGDCGRLEIWMRDSDLRAAQFDNVVSFIRST